MIPNDQDHEGTSRGFEEHNKPQSDQYLFFENPQDNLPISTFHDLPPEPEEFPIAQCDECQMVEQFLYDTDDPTMKNSMMISEQMGHDSGQSINNSQVNREQESESGKNSIKNRKKQYLKNLLRAVFFRMIQFLEFQLEKEQKSSKRERLLEFLSETKEKKVNRKIFVTLFLKEQLRGLIQLMFDCNYLARAIQLGRIKEKNKPSFIAKIPVFKEAFKKGKLPRLQ